MAIREGRKMAEKKSSLEYSFKVNLKGKKSIWRIVVLRGDHTLHNLHKIIFRAFDREEEHLYSFFFPREPRGRDRQSLKVKEYSSPFYAKEPNPITDEQPFNAEETTLDSLNFKVNQTFEYLFDFGDNWLHEIKVVQIESASRTRRLPIISERHGESPPQYPDYEEEDEENEGEKEQT